MLSYIRKTLALCLVTGFIISTGCDMSSFSFNNMFNRTPEKKTPESKFDKKQPDAKKTAPTEVATKQPAAPVAPKPKIETKPLSGKVTHMQGFNMTINIDGQQTRPAEFELNKQIWAIKAPTTGTPSVVFDVKKETIGEFNSARLSIYPYRSGEVDRTSLLRYTGKTKLIPGKPLKLDSFSYIEQHQFKGNIKKLPAGKYRMILHVRGNMIDSQYVDFTVK